MLVCRQNRHIIFYGGWFAERFFLYFFLVKFFGEGCLELMFGRSATMNRLDHFYFEVGGFGDRQTLELMEDGEIVVKLGQAKIPWFYEGAIQLNPNSKKWATFLVEIENLRVWEWEASYHQLDMCDGSQWELQMTMGDKSVKSYGSNKLPENFDQFKEELAKLLS